MSKIETIRQALRVLLAEHERDGSIPTSARFLFYELVTRRIITKHPTGKRRADQDMSDALTDLREGGRNPLGLDRRRDPIPGLSQRILLHQGRVDRLSERYSSGSLGRTAADDPD